MIRPALIHFYRQARAHQRASFGLDGLTGLHALAAYLSAKRHMHFLADMKRLGR